MTKKEIIQGLYKGDSRAIKEAIEILEQQPSEDVMAIHTQGLDEGIRCAMCTNSMKSDTGCDGGCRVDNDMYKKVMDTIKNQIVPPVTPTHGTCKDCKYSSVHTISLDKIDEIRVCRIQFSKQIKDDYYCANYKKRGNENEVN